MPTSDWTPGVVEVGSLLRARTKDTNGNELGTFTQATRPTDTQVLSLIGDAVGEVVAGHGDTLPEALWPTAQRLAVIEAALLVELSYYPEQVASGRSPYPQLLALRDRLNTTLEGALHDVGEDGTLNGTGDALAPVHTFPVDDGGMVGWGTRW